jgi:hypothetical protein
MASSLSRVDGPKLGGPLVKVVVLPRYILLRASRRTTDIGFQVPWGMCFGGSVVLVLVFGTFRQFKTRQLEKDSVIYLKLMTLDSPLCHE